MNARIYADHAATTPTRPEVIEAMSAYLREGAYNPSSLHAEGRRARAALDAARERVAAVLGAKPREIVFTGGGSESDNLALRGGAHALRDRGTRLVSQTLGIPYDEARQRLERAGWNVRACL